jgi:hypothetical protein
MKGLGDNIYQRCFLKGLSQQQICVLDTPFPEIYQDLNNVFFEPCKTRLRTQAKNARKTDHCGRKLSELQSNARVRRSRGNANVTRTRSLGAIHYGDTGIINGLEQAFKTAPSKMDLPSFEPSARLKSIIGKKYAVVRPVTRRTEWISDSRNPKPEYIFEAVEILKKNNFLTVSIADVDGTNETFVGQKPNCDIEFNRGELGIKEVLCLVEHCSFALGGIGWIVPAAIAYEKKSCFVSGGWGHFNHPEKLLPRYETPSIDFLMPENFCLCRKNAHDCDKEIKNFNQRFEDILCKPTQS